jgi:hypothetical protein
LDDLDGHCLVSHCFFLGRPPFLPLRRAAAAFDFDVLRPISLARSPRLAAKIELQTGHFIVGLKNNPTMGYRPGFFYGG